MRTLLRLVFLVVLAVVVFMPAIRVGASDTVSYAVVPVQDGGQPPTVVVENKTDFDALYLLIAATAGLFVGGGGVAVILGRANQSQQLKDSTEQLLYNSTNPETLKLLHSLAEGSQQLTTFLARQFTYPGVPEAISAAIKQAVQTASSAADFVEAVTDGESNAPQAAG